MMKACLLLILFIPAQVLAQIHSGIEKYDTDSLKRLVPQRSGAALVDVWNALAVSYAYYNPLLCEKYALLALQKSIELDYKKGTG
ncbi:MAG: hypothetical protein RBS55_08155, partial [Bacteroidales bacterium]|nr:hypothetical protein [Bacteroidales bacterium]